MSMVRTVGGANAGVFRMLPSSGDLAVQLFHSAAQGELVVTSSYAVSRTFRFVAHNRGLES